MPEAFHNLHSEADKSQSIWKPLIYIFGFTGTIPCILQLNKVKTLQREKFIVHSWVWEYGESS